MCYSAMAEQNAKKLARMLGATVDIESYRDLFQRRLDGEKLYINKAMEIPFLNEATSMPEKGVGKVIREWQDAELERLSEAKAVQETRLANATASLKKKETKKALEDVRIATSKISKFELDLSRIKEPRLKSESQQRIYPLHFVSMLALDESGNKVIRPFRYLLRPHNEDESFDFKRSGCYNARLDSLGTVPFWRDCVGKRHGVMVIKKFYENVPTVEYLKKNKLSATEKAKENIVVCFEPADGEYLFIPTLWDVWKKRGESPLYSAAAITDEPFPEVARAGHQRTPIPLLESAVDSWLESTAPLKELRENILSQRASPTFGYRVLGEVA